MQPAIAKYDVYLAGESQGCHGEAIFREWREPDEFGDPGKVIRRELVQITLNGLVYTDINPIHKGRIMSIRTAKLARQPTWELE